MYKIILFYKYVKVDNPIVLKKLQLEICKELGLKGRMIIAQEGINATLEGNNKSIKEYILDLKSDQRFSDVRIKISEGTGNAFPKLSIKVRKEIVSLDLAEDLDPNQISGKYIEATELHSWIKRKKEFYIIDMRNDYEQVVGLFDKAITLGMENFRDLPKKISKIESLKNKTIVTVCTGGVRCEKASGYLIKSGFSDVYQLKDGIVSYMERYPNEDFKGSLYVFDNRIIMGFNRSDPKREIISRCVICNRLSENYINCSNNFCHRHFILCNSCIEKNGLLCPMGCRVSRHGIAI